MSINSISLSTTLNDVPIVAQALAHPVVLKISGLTENANHASLSEALTSHLQRIEPTLLTDDEKSLLTTHWNKWISALLYSVYLFQYDAKRDFLNKEYYKQKYIDTISELKQNMGEETFKQMFSRLISASMHQEHVFFAMLYHTNTYCDQAYAFLSRYQRAEELGHNYAYLYEDSNGINHNILELKDHITNRGTSYYRVPIRVVDKDIDQRLIGEILIPTNDKATQIENSEQTVYICWAGTHSKKTLLADTERSAGEETYRKHENQVLPQIISAINNYAESIAKPIHVIFTGHSLGAAYAQLSFHSLQRAIARKLAMLEPEESFAKAINTESIQFTKDLAPNSYTALHIDKIPFVDSIDPNSIASMGVDVWNAIGVVTAVEESSNRLCRILVDKGIKQTANYGMVHGDVLQMVGKGTILSDIPNNGATVSVLKVTTRYSMGVTSKTGTALGTILAGKVIGNLVFPVVGGFIGGLLGGGISLFTMAYHSMQAHMKFHFSGNESALPSSYKLLLSSIPAHVDDLLQELNSKSVLINNSALLLSKLNLGEHQRSVDLDFRMLVMNNDIAGMQRALENISTFYTGSFIDYTSQQDIEGNTPLHYIAATNNIALWQVIAEFTYRQLKTHQIVDFTVKNVIELMPIEVAAIAGHIDLVKAMAQSHLADAIHFNQDKIAALIQQAETKICKIVIPH